MTLEELKNYCLVKTGSDLFFPFDNSTAVVKFGGKIFALFGIDNNPLTVSLKCDPFLAVMLREKYSGIIPGYHLNKKHWNTVLLDGSIPDEEIKKMIDHSYELIVSKSSKKRSI